MSESNKKIKHFIMIRFFTFDDPKYPHDIYDTNFLSKQLVLAENNALKSLENQTNKNFDLIFLVNDKFFDNPTYEFIFSTLQNATTLPIKFIKIRELPRLFKDAYDNYDFVIQSRIDFDDFVFKDAVTDTQSKVDECKNILAYGYCSGYEYIKGDLRVYDHKFNGTGHHSILQSLILKSSFAKTLPFINMYSLNHTKIKLKLKELLEKNGIDFAENMFQQNTLTKAYIYFRHDSSHRILTHNGGKPVLRIPNSKKITGENITKAQLEEEFGFHLELNSIK